ncbi:uncharacterized protein LOC141665862 [Apium graveolens]|uniref:uncharacterized protein LOC141665862 n=1 Tax=Apium graveolens TaxID=4045 RepID=UPI003D7970ED
MVFYGGGYIDSNNKLSSIWPTLKPVNANAPYWTKMVWPKFSIPKCSVLLWLVLKNRLLTTDHRMLQFNMVVDPHCVLCGAVLETQEHFYVQCPFTAAIFREAPVSIDLSWDDLHLDTRGT